MIAFLFSLLLFAFWCFVGRAALRLLRPSIAPLAAQLIAPAVGIAVCVIPVFWLSRSGLPVGNFADALVCVFALVAFGVNLRISGGTHADTGYRGFLFVFFGAALLIGWPFFKFGFAWVSFCNNDMANYCLLAQRLIKHGFFDVPSANELFDGTALSQSYWLQGLLERVGVELLLAVVSAVTRLPTAEAYMPLIISFHLSLVSVTCALAFVSISDRRLTLLAGAFAAVAPLLSFGALYQLLGQTAGLQMLYAGVTASVCLNFGAPRSEVFRTSVLVSALVSALLILYPETSPFYVGIVGAYAALKLITASNRRQIFTRVFCRNAVLCCGFVAAFVICTLQTYCFGAFQFLVHQVDHGVTGDRQATELFHQYLLPSGLGGLWGLLNIYDLFDEPWLSTSILAGAVLVSFTIYRGLAGLRQVKLVEVSALIMLSGAMLLMHMRASFGLYKIAMFMQPLIWSSLCLSIVAVFSKFTAARRVLLTVLFLCCLRTQWEYVRLSYGVAGRHGGAFNEIVQASTSGIYREIANVRTNLQGQRTLSDTHNVVLGRFEALALEGVELRFPSYNLFPTKGQTLKIPQAPWLEPTQEQLRLAELERLTEENFPMGSGAEVNPFWTEKGTQPEDTSVDGFSLLIHTALQSLTNRRRFPSMEDSIRVMPMRDVRDHLIIIDSALGSSYYRHNRENIAHYQLEPDYYFPGRTMSGLGRRFVLQSIRPSDEPRLVLDITASLKGDGDNSLPPVVAIGTQSVAFDVAGRGSARIFSAPVTPRRLHSRQYLGLDMGKEGTYWEEKRTGLMRLYGVEHRSDPRVITVFGRDISLISEQEYRTLEAPEKLDQFPAQLSNINLEYSGIYEDGWVGEESYLYLKPAGDVLEIRGVIPGLKSLESGVTLNVSVDGAQQEPLHLAAGAFQTRMLVNASLPSRAKIRLSFDKVENLLEGDRRPVSAKLESIGFIECRSGGEDIVEKGEGILLGRGWHALESERGRSFRWVGEDAELLVAGSDETLRLELEVAPGPGVQQITDLPSNQPLRLELLEQDGTQLGTGAIGATRATGDGEGSRVLFAIPASPTTRSVYLHIEGGGRVSGSDTRVLNFRVFKIRSVHD